MTALDSLYPRLTEELAALVRRMPDGEREALEEIRAYIHQPLELAFAGSRRRTNLVMDAKRMDSLLAALSGFALYRFERQIAEGYIPLPGGHRAGVCGAMVRLEDGRWQMKEVTSVCVRVARRIDGASAALRGHLFDPQGGVRRVLLLGAPGCGKTTVLRDAALYMAKHIHVAVADEREELFAQGLDCMDGVRLDVLRGVDKARAFPMLIRSMSPKVIVCDELGREEDAQAMLDAARCGVGVLASAHADGLDGMLRRPALRHLFDMGAFDRYVHLGYHGSIRDVWDHQGRRLEGKEWWANGELGYGGDGDDRREQHRVSAVGRRKEACALDSGDETLPFAALGRHPL